MKTVYKWKSGFAEAAQNYISLKQQTGMKFETQERYLRHFDTFYYSNGFEGSTLTKEIANDFIYDPNERPGTHYNKEVLMRDFAMYLADRGYHAYIVEVKTKLPRCKFVPQILTDDETRRIFTAIDNYPHAHMSYRNAVDPVLFRFLYSTGVRISEALNLVLKDVNIESGIATIRAAKNMKDRLIPMTDSLSKRIIPFMKGFHRYSDDRMWLFPDCHNGTMGQMDKSTAYNHFRDYLLMADIPHTDVGPRIHSFRHGFAVKCRIWGAPHIRHSRSIHLYRAILPLALLAEWLGHAQLETTQVYSYADTEMKRDAIKKATDNMNPLIVKEEKPCWKNENSEELIRKLYGLR